MNDGRDTHSTADRRQKKEKERHGRFCKSSKGSSRIGVHLTGMQSPGTKQGRPVAWGCVVVVVYLRCCESKVNSGVVDATRTRERWRFFAYAVGAIYCCIAAVLLSTSYWSNGTEQRAKPALELGKTVQRVQQLRAASFVRRG